MKHWEGKYVSIDHGGLSSPIKALVLEVDEDYASEFNRGRMLLDITDLSNHEPCEQLNLDNPCWVYNIKDNDFIIENLDKDLQ